MVYLAGVYSFYRFFLHSIYLKEKQIQYIYSLSIFFHKKKKKNLSAEIFYQIDLTNLYSFSHCWINENLEIQFICREIVRIERNVTQCFHVNSVYSCTCDFVLIAPTKCWWLPFCLIHLDIMLVKLLYLLHDFIMFFLCFPFQ